MMIRVVVVEDSPTARALLVAILSSDPELQIVGEARDGLEAVAMTRRLRPDVVTMDICMPRMNGFEATKEIMIAAPTPIVLVTASLLTRDVETSMNALRAGALAVLPKPGAPGSPDFDTLSQQLVTTVKAMSQVKVVRHWRPRPERGSQKAGGTWLKPGSLQGEDPLASVPRGQVVAIATSTGGPAALHRLFSLLGQCPVPILVVQHITRGFSTGLADWLNKATNLHVKVAEEGEPLSPHTAYLAPDDRHLGVTGHGRVALSMDAPVGGFRPSATVLFESTARAYGASTVAVILTGMGDDGVEGLRAVRQAGGRIFAQDEASSVIFGMPGAAVAAGLADLVLPLDDIPSRLLEVV